MRLIGYNWNNEIVKKTNIKQAIILMISDLAHCKSSKKAIANSINVLQTALKPKDLSA